jgi:hypothetical protein
MSNGLVVVVSGMLQGKTFRNYISGADPGFQVRGGALKNYLGVFRVKNHDFTQKNHIFSNLGGAPPPWIRPCILLVFAVLCGNLNIQHILCCVFVLFVFVLLPMLPVSRDCSILIPLRYSLTFISGHRSLVSPFNLHDAFCFCYDKIRYRFYCPIKVPARGTVITQKNNKHSNT